MEIRATAVCACPVPNFDPDMPSFFEALDETGRAVGTLTIFSPAPDAGEITAFVQPGHRRQGVFRALLSASAEALGRSGYGRVLLVCSGDGAEGQAVAAHWGLALDHAEYFMVWKGPLPDAAPLELGPAAEADVPALVELTMDAFQDDRDQALQFVQTGLPLCRVARRDGQIVAAANVQEGEVLSIYGVAVPAALRGQGLGKALMAALLQSLSAGHPDRQITLEVDSLNARALALYQSCGFVTARREDYYAASLAEIRARCAR